MFINRNGRHSWLLFQESKFYLRMDFNISSVRVLGSCRLEINLEHILMFESIVFEG